MESIQPIVNIVNEASAALNDKNRTIRGSAIKEVFGGTVGAGLGGAGSLAALCNLGVPGLSAAGITSGLASARSIVGAVWWLGFLFLLHQ